MFTMADFESLVRARPFVPFRLYLSDGGAVEVRSAEQCLPFRRFAVIALLDPNSRDAGFDRYMVAWYMHLTRAEHLRPGGPPMEPPGPPSDQLTPTIA